MKRLGTSDWRVSLQQQIVDTQNRLNNSRLPEEWREWLKVRIEQQQYYLDHDINPNAPGAPTFTRAFIEQGITLFVPLLVMIVAIDIVSGERSDGTIKMLLTRPVRRWKVLFEQICHDAAICFADFCCLSVSSLIFYRGLYLATRDGCFLS
ncbi:hypothetical protein GCM10020331_021550 [Ectobacillus funiculus]